MASLRLSKGPITINRGVDGETHETILVITAAFSPKIHLGAGHSQPLPLTEGDMRFVESNLSDDAKKALRLIVAEIEAKVMAKAKLKAAEFTANTGITVDG